MRTKTFRKILKEINAGNIAALERVYEEYYEKMAFTAQYILHDPQDARDAASAVILKILVYAKNHENPQVDAVGAYIYRAVKNAAIDIYNKKKNTIPLEYIEEAAAVSDLLEYKVETKIDLYRILATFSDSDRQLVEMFYFYDYKIKTIAQTLHMPAGTVKWKLKEIRERLYRQLK